MCTKGDAVSVGIGNAIIWVATDYDLMTELFYYTVSCGCCTGGDGTITNRSNSTGGDASLGDISGNGVTKSPLAGLQVAENASNETVGNALNTTTTTTNDLNTSGNSV